MRQIVYLVTLMFVLVQFQSCKNAKAEDAELSELIIKKAGWNLIWNDEFDQEGLPNPDYWDYDMADGCPHVCGWGNNELQYYTQANKNNARIVDGYLIIEAHKEAKGGKEFTSARLVTRGKNAWRNGKLEIRAKLPSGKGTWPAIWMMPEKSAYGNWPKSGEIDIMEHVGYNPDSIIGTVHTEAFNHGIGTQVGNDVFIPDSESAFHNYSIVWNDKSISWFVDDVQYHSFDNKNKSYKEWPFDKEFYLIMNLAVGGNWGGKHGVDADIWPQQMVVDYVRVYKEAKTIND